MVAWVRGADDVDGLAATGRCMIPSRTGGQASSVPILPSSCRDKVVSAD